MMDFTERMLEKICLDVNGTTEVKVGDNIISFKTPFPRVTMIDSIKHFTGIDISGMDENPLSLSLTFTIICSFSSKVMIDSFPKSIIAIITTSQFYKLIIAQLTTCG